MIISDRVDIENWASRFEAKGYFPEVISRLTRVTTPFGTRINIPSGSAAYLGGWDGIIECDSDTAYLPKGISLLEFGTESAVKGKADEDYEKRTANSLGYDISKSTFIFITPRIFAKKNKWKQAKLAEGKWKDIRVYDSVDLQQWINMSGSVARWFATLIGRLPSDNVLIAEQYWKEWSEGERGTLPPATVTSGREREMQQLDSFFSGGPGIRGVKASTKSEAIAFIIAAAMQFEDDKKELFFSKTLIIDTEGSYRSVHINSPTPLNLIPKFDETLPLFIAVSGGHHVIVPLGADDDSFNADYITLPTIMRDGQVDALVQMGLTKEDAEKYSLEAGRNITVLRRLLKFHGDLPTWFSTENVMDILPAMLLGRWNEDNVGDREILEKFSGKTYQEYLKILNRWKSFEESPILQIGQTWRLTAPLDLWTALSNKLSEKDFTNLADFFLMSYQNNDTIEYDDDARFVSYFNKPKRFSGWAQEGLTQSLILIGQYGLGLELSKLGGPQFWVDKLLEKLLFNSSAEKWIEYNQKLPLLSEASPDSFFKAVKHSLALEERPIMEMFKENGGGIFGSSSNHTGLLWALEGLAWLPEYLFDATTILLHLTEFDPGGSLSNRPKKSLSELYKSWHWQTLANYEERMQILKKAVLLHPKNGWDLLIGMLPKHHDAAMQNHKMRWRLFDKNTHIDYTYAEIYKSHTFVVELLIELYDASEEKFSQLISESVTLGPADNEIMLKFLESKYSSLEQVDYNAWHTLRKLLSHHRSYPDAEWAAPEIILKRYESLYDALAPKDTLAKYKWLFDVSYIDFTEGKITDENYEDKQKKIQERTDTIRIEGINKITAEFGFSKVLEIAKSAKEPGTIGYTLAKIDSEEEHFFLIFDQLKADNPNTQLVHRFVQVNSYQNGLEWIFDQYYKLEKNKYDSDVISNLFLPVQQTKELWNFIDTTNESIRKAYWSKMYPSFYHLDVEEKIMGLKYLLEFKRYFTAIDAAYSVEKEIPSDLIAQILEKAGSEKAEEPIHIREYEISSLFKELNERKEIPDDRIAKLEWLYLEVLASYGSGYNPKKLHHELATSPEFFNEIIKWVYRPMDESVLAEERKDVSDETLMNFAKQGYRLLDTWHDIPGVSESGEIDSEFLNFWIDEVRRLGEASSRIEVTDAAVGKILAQYSEKNKNYWPPDEISDVLERINTDSLKNNFSSGTYNKRGSSSRMPFDGGTIERGHAEHFQKLAELHKVKHPNVSKIFKNMAEHYLEQAKREDEQAERSKLEH